MPNSLITLLFILTISPVLAQNPSPGNRDHLGLAYHEETNSIILFGGNDVNAEGKYIWNPTTWKWQNFNWSKVDEATPGSISSMSMCYDADGKQLVMMGGINPNKGDLDETWIWKESKWKLYQGESPGTRLSAAMAYDYSQKELVLFSGCVGQDYPTDTWVFKENAWTKVSDSGPRGVCRAAMFFDHVRNSIILFGGALSRSGKSNEMWEWTNNQWRIVDQGINKPEPRANIQMAYDENRKKAVLYAGSGTDGLLDDLWEWDGNKWVEKEKQSIWPGSLEVYGIAYHKKLKKTLLYGGRTGFAKPVNNFWSWDGTSWKKLE